MKINVTNILKLDEREVQLQLLIQLQTEYQLSQQDVTRQMDEAQDKLDEIKPGGTVPQLESQLNQLQMVKTSKLQVQFEIFS